MENLLFILYNNMDIVLSPPPLFFSLRLLPYFLSNKTKFVTTTVSDTIMKRKLNYSIHMIVVGVEHQHWKALMKFILRSSR